jgi:hypothetical protein
MEREKLQKISRVLFILLLVVPIIYILVINIYKPHKVLEVKSFKDIINGSVRYDKLLIEESYVEQHKNEIKREIFSLSEDSEIEKFLEGLSDYKFSNEISKLEDIRTKAGGYMGRNYLIFCYGETNSTRVTISFNIAPETKAVYLMHTIIKKGADTGDMNIKDYYSIQDELYDNIMKSYIEGN